MTTEYTVTWRIELDADSPEEAARKALSIHRNPNSIATVFEVAKDGKFIKKVDVLELDDENERT